MIAVALLTGFLAWVLVAGDDDDGESAPATEATALEPVATSRAGLLSLARELGHPLFWAGSQQGTQLEATRDREGGVFLRYLTGDTEVGDPRDDYLTIGTYPFPDPIDALERLAERKGALLHEAADGTVALTNESEPTSVYLAYPDQHLQIEVYDPDPERAFRLAVSGDVVPVE